MTQEHKNRFSAKQVPDAFSRKAESYDAHADLQRVVLAEALRLAKPYLQPYATMLDAGCGTGYLMEVLSDFDLPLTVIGCDAAFGMCEYARRMRNSKDKDFLLACADMQSLPFAENHFDMVLSSLAIQWIMPPAKALAELYRTLKPGGHVVATTFGAGTLREMRYAFSEVDEEAHVSPFTTESQLRGWIAESGFEIASFQTTREIRYHASVRAMMLSLRHIGATNKLETRRKTMTGRQRLEQMERIYRQQYATDEGIPVSWEVMYMVLQKPEKT